MATSTTAVSRRGSVAALLGLVLSLLSVSPAVAATEVGASSRYQPLAPQRILDTRVGLGAPQSQPRAGATVDLKVTGVGGVPEAGVTAVSLNVTVTDTRQVGYVQVLPAGTGVLGASSNINVTGPDQTASNLVTVPVGVGGRVTLYDVAGGHLIADVQGYFAQAASSSDGRYEAVAPVRVVDSRDRTGLPPVTPPPAPEPPVAPPPPPAPPAPGPVDPGDTKNCTDFATWAEAYAWFMTYYPTFGDVAGLDRDGDGNPCESLPGAPGAARGEHVTAPAVGPQADAQAMATAFDPSPVPAAGESITVRLAGTAGVPWAGASAVALTVTATESIAAGFVQVSPTGGSTPVGSTSNVNLTAAGQTVANLVIVPLGASGSVQLYNSSGTHLIVDVVGYFTDFSAPVTSTGLFVPVSPARLSDTRTGTAPSAGSETRLNPLGRTAVPPTGVAALFLNATATQTTGPGYLQVFPTGRAAPGTSSSVNFTAAGQTVATAALGGVGEAGQVSVYTPTSTHVVIDVFGYFTGPPTFAGDVSVLDALRIAEQAPGVAYVRDSWRHWTDEDGDCQDTRDEVLIAESITTPILDAAGCNVVSGTWIDPYTGHAWTVPSDLDVDHVVALKNAHDSGAWAWDAATKRAFANDLGYDDHLIAVEDNLNQRKSDAGPEAWRPPSVAYWCQYATDWATIKTTWTLTVTQAEYDALAEMLLTC